MIKTLFSRQFVVAFLLTLLCSLAGSFLGGLPYLSVIGALVIALILGMLMQFAQPAVAYSQPGIGLISNKFLRLGIILLGFKLNLIALAQAGIKTILLAVVIVSGTILLVYSLARRFGVDRHLAILVASGTGICGAAAVMGISSQFDNAASETEAERQRENKVVAVAIVAILGTLFTLLEIGIKPLLHMSAVQFGVMTGGSLHEIAHAVAAGSAGGPVSLVDVWEKSHHRDAEFNHFAAKLQEFVDRQTVDAGHGGNGRDLVFAFLHEHRQDEVIGRENGFTHQSTRKIVMAHAAHTHERILSKGLHFSKVPVKIKNAERLRRLRVCRQAPFRINPG